MTGHHSDQDHHVSQPGTSGDGTLLFMAPEAILTRQFTFASDIWALGCVLFELCTLRSPFGHCRDWQQIYRAATRGDYGSVVSPAAASHWPRPYGDWLQELVDGMLEPDAQQRASIGWLVRQPAITAQFYANYFDYANEEGAKK